MEKISFDINGKKKEGIVLTKKKLDNDTEYNIKLENGYNVILKQSEIENIEISQIEKQDESLSKNVREENLTNNNSNMKVLILHTGGTIASKIDYETGAVYPKFNPDEIVQMFPEISQISQIETDFVSNIASDDIRFYHFNLLIEKIAQKQKDFDGIIVTCGTDNLHYLSSGLHFGLENLKIPVLIVGSQRSSDRPSSDAFLNLASAVKFIEKNKCLEKRFLGVGVCMHKSSSDDVCSVLHGLNARKNHSSKRDAFIPINREEIANVNFYENEVIFNEKDKDKNLVDFEEIKNKELKINLYKDDLKIGILKIHPNFFPEEILFYENFDGLIIEATGLGHLPITKSDEATKIHLEILENLKKIASKIPVVVSVQTINGKANLNVYSPARKLQEIGVLGNFNELTSESSFIKLAYLLSQNLNPKDYFN